MTQEIHTFYMLEPVENYKECRALLGGKEVIVDPYVGCVWGYKHFEKGKVVFDGHWWESDKDESKVFLPRRQIFDDNLCAVCKQGLQKGWIHR